MGRILPRVMGEIGRRVEVVSPFEILQGAVLLKRGGSGGLIGIRVDRRQ
jgi:hypothetical protein